MLALLAQVNAAGWPDPFGWLYRNTVGNLAAGFIQVAISAVVAALLWPPSRRALHRFVDGKLAALHGHHERRTEHDRWAAEHLAKLYLHVTGVHPDVHPQHGALTEGLTPPGKRAAKPPTA